MARSTPADRGAAYFPAFVDLLRKKVVVVGGGKIATAKVRALLPCRPAPLVVVAPRAATFIRQAAHAGKLHWLEREYAAGDLVDAALVFGATDDRRLNAQVAADARGLNIPVLAVDDVPNCDFIAPALVRRGDITIAISTSGRSPAMARRTRERLERSIPSWWGQLLDVAATAREQLGVARALIEPDAWQTALDGDVERLAGSGALDEAADLLLGRLERTIFDASGDAVPHGLVSLVGAGPSDADLLTLRAVQRLQAADVVVHDRLVSAEVLAFARADAERIDVGKSAGGHGWRQADIDALLVRLGQAGKRVVRLKGGDPFVFGRGGEEALALVRAGVPWEVVPGVSSALAAPAAAGIPVTHRGLSASVTIVNGHDADQHDWSALARAGGTLVFLMPVERLEEIGERLLEHGRPAGEPTAIVEWATTPRQRVLAAPLIDMARGARAARVGAPAVLVVGPTAALAAALQVPGGQTAGGQTQALAVDSRTATGASGLVAAAAARRGHS